jgi:hypothetical protein
MSNQPAEAVEELDPEATLDEAIERLNELTEILERTRIGLFGRKDRSHDRDD